jgi:hypothetical protein
MGTGGWTTSTWPSSPSPSSTISRTAARVGEAQIIAAGGVERTRIIQTAIPAETHSRVEALLSHGPSRPLEASVEPPKHLTNDELQLLLGVLLLTISLGGLALLLVLFA